MSVNRTSVSLERFFSWVVTPSICFWKYDSRESSCPLDGRRDARMAWMEL